MGSGVFFKGGKVFGAPKEGDTDTFLIQTFDNVVLTDFVQTGLTLESSPRTNLALYSDAIDNSYWLKTGLTIVPDAILGPDELNNVDKIVETAASTTHRFNGTSIVADPSTIYVMSAFVKADTRRYGRLRLATNIGFVADIFFDAQDGVINGGTYVSGGIEPWGTGYRVWVSGVTQPGTTTVTNYGIYMWDAPTASSGGNDAYVGDGTSGMYAGYMQIEKNKLTGYIRTTSTTSTVSSISGTTSARLVHKPVNNQLLKQIEPVSEKYRGSSMVVSVTGKSSASIGNVTILFRDETNNANIQSSQQIPLTGTISTLQFGVKIPSNCESFSYTVTALPENGAPETYIDDITIRNYWVGTSVQGQTEYRMEVPVITDWSVYTPTFTGFGTVSGVEFYWRRVGTNIEIMGQFTSGTPTPVAAAITFPNSLTSDVSQFGSSRPSQGTWFRKISNVAHGGTIIVDAPSTSFNFAGPETFSGLASNPGTKANGDTLVASGNIVSLSMTCPITEWNHTETKTFTTVDLVPARSMVSNATVDIPIVTEWVDAGPITLQGTTTNPTFGTTPVNKFWWRRNGDTLEGRVELSQTSAGVAGSGDYLLPLPNGLMADGSKITFDNVVEGAGLYDILNNVGTAHFFTTGSDAVGNVSVFDSTRLRCSNIYTDNSNGNLPGVWSSAWYNLTNSPLTVAMEFRIPIANWATTESKTWTATQSVVTEGTDSIFRGRGFTGNGSTNTGILTLSSSISNIGDAITYVSNSILGDSWIVNKAGIYNFHASIDTSGSGGYNYYFTKNATTLTATSASAHPFGIVISNSGYANLNNDVTQVSGSEYLNVGDTIRFHCASSGVSNTNSTIYDFLIISYQGSVKQVQTVSDQKMNIPTSEVKLSGASTRGAIHTDVVRFDSISKIRGDALLVSNSSDFGSTITVQKDGIISVFAQFQKTTSNTALVITLNQSTYTGFAFPVSEYVVTQQSNTTNSESISAAASSITVKAGDVIRVSSNTAPTANASNSLSVFFMETRVAVSVTNVLPQFSDSDSLVRVFGYNGYDSTNTQNFRFTTVDTIIGSDIEYVDSATLGATFTIRADGLYSFNTNGTSSLNQDSTVIQITRNSVGLVGLGSLNSLAFGGDRINTNAVATKYATAAGQAYLRAGDVIRVASNSSINSDTSFAISKVGKPNVTGVDVTPFINVPTVEREYFNRAGANFGSTNTSIPTFVAQTYKNTLGKILSYTNSATLGDSWTALKKCRVFFSFSCTTITLSNASYELRLLKNSITANSASSLDYTGGTVQSGGGPENETARLSGIYELDAGDVLRIHCNSGTGIWNASGTAWVIIEAESLSDQILVEPETFSSDTANLVFGGAVYNTTTIKDAPIGTWIYGHYATPSSNTPTYPTTNTITNPPTNVSGFQIHGRAYSTSHGATLPNRYLIQIGKGHKGWKLGAYQGANKTSPTGFGDFFISGTAEVGSTVVYDELTGVLTVDAGAAYSGSNTFRAVAYDSGNQYGNAYFTINASKNPALVGLDLRNIGARYISTAGQAIGTSFTLLNYETRVADTDLAYSAGIYTVPEKGWYTVNAKFGTNSVVIPETNSLGISIYISGVESDTAYVRGVSASSRVYWVSISESYYLNKGQTISVYGVCNSTSTTMSAIASYNSFSVVKT